MNHSWNSRILQGCPILNQFNMLFNLILFLLSNKDLVIEEDTDYSETVRNSNIIYDDG